MEHFIFALSCVQPLSEASIVFKLVEDGSFCVISTDTLIFHVDLIKSTLLDQPIVLIITDLSFFASF